ncbi:MAG: hypothetical protein ACLGJB_03715 [Blastocatellia bacterium]
MISPTKYGAKPIPDPTKYGAVPVSAFPKQEPEEVKKSFTEKLTSFTGGGILGKGLATAGRVVSGAINQTGNEEGQMSEDQKKLIEAIHAQTDPVRKQHLIDFLKKNYGGAGAITQAEIDPGTTITNKQVVGDALQLGTTALSAGTLPGEAKAVAKAPSALKGIVQGAKAGAKTGTAIGAATGVSQSLKDDKSGGDIVVEGIKGAVTGALTGGLIGGATGGISGARNTPKSVKNSKVFESITPKVNELTPTEYEKLLSQGKILPKTATKPAQYVLSSEEKAAALKYRHLFTSKDPVKNTINVVNEIANKDAKVGEFLKGKNAIFNDGELRNSILQKLQDVNDITVDEARLTNAKTDLVNNFLKGLKKNDMETLWKARKAFDRQIEKSFTGAPTLQNTVKREFRNAIQDFISERTDNVTYKGYMKDMSQLFEMKDVLTTKAAKEKAHNAIQLWIKKNPVKAKLAYLTIGGGILGKIGSSLLKD